MGNVAEFNLNQQLARFRAWGRVRGRFGDFQQMGPDILKFSPHNNNGSLKIGLLALVHGNEVVGLPILNAVAEALISGVMTTSHEIYFGLGNVAAAHADRRFLEKDLNRCFGRRDIDTLEARRAREIETYMLDHVDYLLDLHQTVHPNEHPFFIFQYSSPNCLQHMSLMNSKYPTILQFDAIEDSQHLSTDEYLRSRGGFGVALELGQLGYCPEKFDIGVGTVMKFLENTARLESLKQVASLPQINGKTEFPLYQITDRLKASADQAVLDSKWINFSQLKSGDIIGRSEAGSIIATGSGYVLFPKLKQTLSQGQDLMFLCSEILPAQKEKPEMFPSPADTDLV